MRQAATLYIFCLMAAVALSACGEPDKIGPIDFLTKDQRVRSELERNWTFCRTAGESSALYALEIHGDTAKLSGSAYASKDCSEKLYETYDLAWFNHSDLVATDAHSGTSRIQRMSVFSVGFA